MYTLNFFRAEFDKLGFDVGAVERAAVSHKSDFSIHSVDSIHFMRQVIGANGQILRILTSRLQPDISVQQFTYREDNNILVNQDLDFVQEKVKEWVADGAVSQLTALSACCKYDAYTDKIKKTSLLGFKPQCK